MLLEFISNAIVVKISFSLNSRGGGSSSCGGCCPKKSIEILIAIEIHSKHDF